MEGMLNLEENIYSKLYNISHENIKKNGQDFKIPKRIYLYNAEVDPTCLDILDLLEIEATNEEFIQILYLAVLNRVIDPKAYKSYSGIFNLSQKDFRKTAIKRITSSEEYIKKNKLVQNNIYGDTQNYVNIIPKPSLFFKLAYNAYHKLPEPIKNIIRKARGVK